MPASERANRRRLRNRAWAIAVLMGCGSGSTEPDAVEGHFALQRLNDATLPYDHEGLGCCTYLGGALRLLDGRYTIQLSARNRNTGLTFVATEWGKYARQLAALTFARDSFQVAPFLLDAGTITGNEIRVAFGGEGPGSSDQFRALFVRAP